MINLKKLISATLLSTLALTSFAQNGVSPSTNSPYTRYGFGQLTDQGFGSNKAMGGIGYGLRNGYHINAMNPASYSAVDSLTFIFDVGFSLQNANFKEKAYQSNVKNGRFDYVGMQFRLLKGFGMTIGYLPYSNVGYNFSTSKNITDKATDEVITSTSTYDGNGGLQQAFVGLGYNVLKNLSIGINTAYFYGTIDHTITNGFSNSNAYLSMKGHEITVRDLKFDLGLQYTQNINKNNKFTIGAIYGIGKKLNSKGINFNELEYYNSKGSLSVLSYSADTLKNCFEIPKTIGAGLTYIYKDKLTIGADFTLQKWGNALFFNKSGEFVDRKKISLGIEYLPNKIGRKYFKRIYYRAGAYYSQPYTKINGKEGTEEFGASIGLGLPLFLYNYKSFLNISGQYVHIKPKVSGMLEENYLRINIGLTFNERWFMKWKVD
ncbi:MAG: hypothetical protein ACTTJK_08620 [Phocaeicola sp.]|uniref:hypothetical protein n=1 Tax=Phocaeicola sp. TaxID=2773926 RepID=UPI003F9F567C